MVVPWAITKEASNKATLFVPENKNVRRSYALKIKYGVNKHWRVESIFFLHIGTLSRISISNQFTGTFPTNKVLAETTHEFLCYFAIYGP